MGGGGFRGGARKRSRIELDNERNLRTLIFSRINPVIRVLMGSQVLLLLIYNSTNTVTLSHGIIYYNSIQCSRNENCSYFSIIFETVE